MRDGETERDNNIVLIGMPGVGKSTVGVLLAKALSRDFTDTDLYIQSRECRRLQDILDGHGRDIFLTLEERYILTLDCRGHVIATGGSVVYSEPAMDHLADAGIIVHLDLPFDQLERRINNLPPGRGHGVGPDPAHPVRRTPAPIPPLRRCHRALRRKRPR